MKKYELLDLHQQLGRDLDGAVKDLLTTVDLTEEDSQRYTLEVLRRLDERDFRLMLIENIYNYLNETAHEGSRPGVVGNYTSSVGAGVIASIGSNLRSKSVNTVSQAIDKLVRYQRASPVKRMASNTASTRLIKTAATTTFVAAVTTLAYREYRITKKKCLSHSGKEKKYDCNMQGIKAAQCFIENRIMGCRNTSDPVTCKKKFIAKLTMWNKRYKRVLDRAGKSAVMASRAAKHIKK